MSTLVFSLKANRPGPQNVFDFIGSFMLSFNLSLCVLMQVFAQKAVTLVTFISAKMKK